MSEQDISLQLRCEFATIVKLEGSVAELVEGWKVWEEKILTYGWQEAGTSKALAAKLENYEGLHQKCGLAALIFTCMTLQVMMILNV